MQYEIPYFTKTALWKGNDVAIKNNLNRTLDKKFLSSLQGGLRYPISQFIEHTNMAQVQGVRVCVVFDENGSTGWLDTTWEIFQGLPVAHAKDRVVN